MTRIRKSTFAVLTILTLLISYIMPYNYAVAAEEKGSFELTIMHTNDSHARVERFPLLGTAVKDIRDENPEALLLSAGDVFSGTLYFTVHEGLADLYFMNAIGYDAMTFGNHEFDKNSETLANFIKGADFPFVSANIDFSGDPVLGGYEVQEIGQPGDGGKIYPAIIKEVNGEPVGIFGLTTEDTTFIASPSKEIVFSNAVDRAKETVELLEESGINKIVAVTHIGHNVDVELAKAVDGIDVIVGGHSHTVLPDGELIEKEEPTIIVQTGEYLNNLGKLDVTFDENGVVTDFNAQLLALDAYEADPALQEKVKEYYKDIEELMKEVVGQTTVHLDGERENVRTKETNLGNLIADGMVWKLKQFIPETAIALQNGGGIRASIEKGEITMGDVRTVLPFDNALVAIELTGEELRQALEHSVSAYPETSGGFLHVSGLRFSFDPDQDPYERVHSVEVKTEDGSYVPLDENKFYTVATNSFTAQGGDGFDSLKQAYEDGRMTNIDIPDYEVFAEYLQQFSPVSPEVEGRIEVGKAEDPADPKDPAEPNEPTEPKEPAEPAEPKEPSDPADGDKTDDGKKLPDTATDAYNILFLGSLLSAAGIILYVYLRKRRKSAESSINP